MDIYDIVIVGGGIAGTYCAWRLSEDPTYNPLKICLLEASDRLGGRLYSKPLPSTPDLIAELGGMSFMASHANLFGLVDRLGLTKVDFERFGNHFTYLRNVRLLTQDFKDNPDIIPYQLNVNERGKWDFELITMAIYNALPEISQIPLNQLNEYLKSVLYQGVPLWQMGFSDFLLSQLSREAFQFIRSSMGYDSIFSNWNAYDALTVSSILLKDKAYFKVKEGFDAVPKKMAELFSKKGGIVKLNTSVSSITPSEFKGSRVFQIFFNAQLEGIFAKKVILCLPKRALELLANESPLFKKDRQYLDDLNAVMPIHASKIFLLYDNAWWSKLGITSGRSTTDLPLRQCFYFDANAHAGLLLASYHDGSITQFWKDIDKSKMVEELNRELNAIHGIAIPDPQSSLYQSWDHDPYGCAWHYWKPNYQSWSIMPRLRKPFPGVNLYICGEAYSTFQGYVEGALNTAEKTLEDYFGLRRPSWLPSNYDLGP